MKKLLVLATLVSIGFGAQAALTNNALSHNALSHNALSHNALSHNALASSAPKTDAPTKKPLTVLSQQPIAK
jgi:hypothetical protein